MRLSFFTYMLGCGLTLGVSVNAGAQSADAPIYRIQNANSSKVLAVSYKSQDNSAAVQQYDNLGTPDHLWRFIDAGNGYVRVQNVNSNKVLAVNQQSQANGAPVQQYDDNGTADHLWQVLDNGDGYFRLRNKNSGKVLGVAKASQDNSAQITQFDDNGAKDHLWRALPEGGFRLQNNYSKKVLGLANMSSAEQAHVQQYDDNGTADHEWYFLPNEDASFRIMNAHTNKVMAVDGMSGRDSAQINQIKDGGTRDHDWFLRLDPSQPNLMRIQNANSAKVLAVHQMSRENSAEAEQFADVGSADHVWRLLPETRAPNAPASAAAGETAPPVPRVEAVADLGLVRQSASIQCRDGTFSAAIKGRSVWTFNDTCLSATNNNDDAKISHSSPNFISNTVSWTDNLSGAGGIALNHDHADADGVLRLAIRPTAAEQARADADPARRRFAIWPGQIVPDPVRGRYLMFYGAGFSAGIGIADGGAGIAVVDAALRNVTRPNQGGGRPDASYMWSAGEQGYTDGYVVVGEYLYCYGNKGTAYATTEVRVARVPLAQALDKSKWTYWTGSGWSADTGQARQVFEGGAAGNSLHYNDYLGQFMVVYQPFNSADVLYRVARHPEGPWSQPARLFTSKSGAAVSYAARIHPEFEEGFGKTQYITYVRNTSFNGYGVPMQELPLVKVSFAKP